MLQAVISSMWCPFVDVQSLQATRVRVLCIILCIATALVTSSHLPMLAQPSSHSCVLLRVYLYQVSLKLFRHLHCHCMVEPFHQQMVDGCGHGAKLFGPPLYINAVQRLSDSLATISEEVAGKLSVVRPN